MRIWSSREIFASWSDCSEAIARILTRRSTDVARLLPFDLQNRMCKLSLRT